MKLSEESASSKAPSVRPLPGGWLVVGLLFVVALLNYLDRLMITTMRDPIRHDLSLNDAQFGLFTSVFLWSYAVCSPLGGFMADRLGRRGVILTSLVFWSIATAISGIAHTAGQMMLARVLMGVSEACYIPAALALISDYHRGSTRSMATGLHMVGLYAGSALGGMGGFIADWFGWRSGFYLFGGVGIAYAALLFFTLRDVSAADSEQRPIEDAPARPAFREAAGVMFSTGGFYFLIGVNVLVGIVNWTVNGWLPTFFQDHLQLAKGPAGTLATLPVQIASLAGVLAAGAIADRWSRKNHRARAIVPAIGWLLAGPALILVATSGMLPLVILGLIFFGVGRGAFDANQMPIVRQLIDQRYSATAYGCLNFIGTSVGGVMVYVGGWLKDTHPGQGTFVHMFQFCGMCLMGVGVLLFLLRMPRRPVAVAEQEVGPEPLADESRQVREPTMTSRAY